MWWVGVSCHVEHLQQPVANSKPDATCACGGFYAPLDIHAIYKPLTMSSGETPRGYYRNDVRPTPSDGLAKRRKRHFVPAVFRLVNFKHQYAIPGTVVAPL